MRHPFRSVSPLSRVGAALIAAVVFSGCNIQLSNQAEAHDEWKRSYTLTNPGTFELRDANGDMHVQTGDGDAVEVQVKRTVRAATDEAAKDALAHLAFTESVSPNRIAIDTTSQKMLTGSREFEYHVRVPKWAAVTVDTSNGTLTVDGLGGPLRVSATNGTITGTGLENAARVVTTNGETSLEFSSLAAGDVVCETTNGEVTVALPSHANARIRARVTNGAITHTGLTLQTVEDTYNRLDASLGTGGPLVSLSATNGSLTVKAR
jgi:DUF4097 and DUF4098 domain-containing protein YvlB